MISLHVNISSSLKISKTLLYNLWFLHTCSVYKLMDYLYILICIIYLGFSKRYFGSNVANNFFLNFENQGSKSFQVIFHKKEDRRRKIWKKSKKVVFWNCSNESIHLNNSKTHNNIYSSKPTYRGTYITFTWGWYSVTMSKTWFGPKK